MLMATPELSIYLVSSFSCAWLPDHIPCALCVWFQHHQDFPLSRALAHSSALELHSLSKSAGMVHAGTW